MKTLNYFLINVFFIIHCFASLNTKISEAEEIVILEKFKYCHGYKKSSIIDLNNLRDTCHISEFGSVHEKFGDFHKDTDEFKAVILHKNNHEIYVYGFECEQQDLIYKFSKTWF